MDETAFGFETDEEREYRELLEECEKWQDIAADLLAALEGLESLTKAIAEQRLYPSELRVAPEIAAARAAIAKAKGGA